MGIPNKVGWVKTQQCFRIRQGGSRPNLRLRRLIFQTTSMNRTQSRLKVSKASFVKIQMVCISNGVGWVKTEQCFRIRQVGSRPNLRLRWLIFQTTCINKTQRRLKTNKASFAKTQMACIPKKVGWVKPQRFLQIRQVGSRPNLRLRQLIFQTTSMNRTQGRLKVNKASFVKIQTATACILNRVGWVKTQQCFRIRQVGSRPNLWLRWRKPRTRKWHRITGIRSFQTTLKNTIRGRLKFRR